MILTNAAGGIEPELHPGDLVLISDHINLMGTNPLIGRNDDSLGPRFPDMTEAYSREYREIARQTGAELGIELKEARLRGGCWGQAMRLPPRFAFCARSARAWWACRRCPKPSSRITWG